MFLFNDIVAACCGDHLLVIDVSQVRDLSDRGPVTTKLVGMNDLWDVIFNQNSGKKGLRRLGISVPLKENIEHEPVLVHCSPSPMPDAIDARTNLVQRPPGTPTAQLLSKEGAELDAPLTEGVVTCLKATLVEQFLHVSVTQGKAVVELLWACWMMTMGKRWR